MQIAVIIPCHPQTPHDTFVWTLEGFSQQVLDAGLTLEVLVGMDGGDGRDSTVVLPEIPPSQHLLSVHSLPCMGAAAVRNALVRRCHTRPELLIFANADTRPAPDMVQQHVRTMASLPAKSLVLGAAPWERVQPTVLDTLIDSCPMVFSYCHLTTKQWYPFRTAYSLNLSIRYQDFQEVGGFPEEIRPYYYEDLAFAYRVLGPQRAGVFYAPAARVLHRHPLTFASYLDREEMLGLMAPVLAQVCPDAFAALMAGRSVETIADDFRQKLAGDKTLYPPLFRHLQEKFTQPANTLGAGEGRTQAIQRLYQLHLPLRLLAFRVGFLQGLKWLQDQDWQRRRPSGLWRPWVGAPSG
jgi:hypothetical protein